MMRTLSDRQVATGTCSRMRHVVYEYLDGELPADADTLVREHLAVCPECLGAFTHQRAFLDAVARAGCAAPRSDSLHGRVARLLDRATQQPGQRHGG
ncbi:MAG TPA: zf-HC2 domain-containing protein [Gemmatimonadaceae bacterium]|jgi:anti-sigma factor RsiW|nr:zf-HC2 domain-containing protein [Gemmatimonadaceae bacterium]